MNANVLMTYVRLPGRLDVEQTAALLGFQPHDVPVLIRAKLLKPLGNPAPNAPKYFAACDVRKLAHDRDMLDKATKTVGQHWRRKNGRFRLENTDPQNGVETFMKN